MTAFDYARSRATADRLIKRFGQAGAIRRSVTTGGQSWNPGSGSTVTTDYPCTLVLLDYSAREIDGSLIRATDKRVLIAKADLMIEPLQSDGLVIGGKAYSIMNVSPLSPGGTVVLYEVQARA